MNLKIKIIFGLIFEIKLINYKYFGPCVIWM